MQAALAAPAGGYRLGPSAPVDMVSARQVTLINPGDEWLVQVTPRLRKSFNDRGSLDLELPLVATGSGDAFAMGPGQLRVGIWGHLKPGLLRHSLGVEFATPVVPRTLQVSSWGSLSRETLAAGEGMFIWEAVYNDDAPWTMRLGFGMAIGDFDLYAERMNMRVPRGEFALAKVVPLRGPWSVVLEGEMITDFNPISGRVLARVQPSDRTTIDLGVQVPLLEWAVYTPQSVQIIAQLRWLPTWGADDDLQPPEPSLP